ncbi:inactive serine protease PAMR1-like [Oculina patagonica]
MTGCLNGGSCVPDERKETFSCSCKLPWTGEKCETKIEDSSCDEAQMKGNQKLPNGEYLLTNGSVEFQGKHD